MKKARIKKKKSTYEKGKEFEDKFARYMLKKLGYDKVKTKKSITGQENVKGTEADIIGIVHDPRSERFRKLAIGVLVLAFLILVAGAMELIAFNEDEMYFIIFLEFCAVVYAIIGRKLGDKYTWVECKNRQAKSDTRWIAI